MAMPGTDERTRTQRTSSSVVATGAYVYKPALPVPFPVIPLDQERRAEWILAQRIAASSIFAKSDLLQRFLLYVCERELTGRTQEITETQIGVQVFQRPDSYNPAEDNIVRSYARNLRKRLEDYFRTEGLTETIRISIPRGAYVPVFSRVDSAASEPVAPFDTAELAIPIRGARVWERIALAIAICVIAALLLMVWRQASLARRAEAVSPRPASTSDAVWRQMFQSNRDTILVPADSGLGILENLTHKPVDLASYESAAYMDDNQVNPAHLDSHSLIDLKTQQYTSVVDLNIVSALERLPEFDGSHTRIRAPRSLSPSDMKQANVVLVGSVHTNPWVAIFEKQLNFHLVYRPEVDDSYVLNDHPSANEQPTYRNEAGTAKHRTYAVIDYLPNLDGTGHVLIIQGLTMAGTQAAADILLSSSGLPATLQGAYLDDGSLRPFEILIETSTMGADAPDAHIIATRFHGS